MKAYSEEFMRDYLLGKLAPAESQAFEQEMEQDPDIATGLELQRDILIGIREGFDQELRAKLQAELDADEATPVRRIPIWRWASAAAIILGSLGVYFYMNQTTLQERLYAAHFQDFPNIVAPGQRGGDAAAPAFAAYYAERWAVSISAFESLQKLNPEATYPIFYQAMAHMHLQAWNEAIPLFEQVRARGDQRFEDPAEWYVGLSYMITGEEQKAKMIFGMIAGSNSNYRQDAEDILTSLP